MKFGAIEAGGTKFVCAIGDEKGKVLERISIPTETPEKTMPQVIQFFKNHDIEAMGIGSFGPIDINQNSQTYGSITSTPKLAWKNYPLLKMLQKEFPYPMGFNTDVNGAALGELTHGAAKGLKSCLYITVGTGIGAGAVVQGNLLQGLSHPEMGHILIRRHPEDPYKGKCPYHDDCLEGLASGPAIEERWGKKGTELMNNQKVWEIEAYYLAQALMQFFLILSPEKMIMGGGVMKQRQLFPLIHEKLAELMNHYVGLPALKEYIVPPVLEDNAGIVGAIELAKQAFSKQTS